MNNSCLYKLRGVNTGKIRSPGPLVQSDSLNFFKFFFIKMKEMIPIQIMVNQRKLDNTTEKTKTFKNLKKNEDYRATLTQTKAEDELTNGSF